MRLGPDRHGKADRKADILANDGVRIGGTDFDRLLSLGVVMPLFGFGSAMKRAGQRPTWLDWWPSEPRKRLREWSTQKVWREFSPG